MKLIAVLLLAVTALSACSKEKSLSVKESNIIGKWKWVSATAVEKEDGKTRKESLTCTDKTYYQIWTFSENGRMEMYEYDYGDEYKGDGSWSLEGKKIITDLDDSPVLEVLQLSSGSMTVKYVDSESDPDEEYSLTITVKLKRIG